MIFLLFLMGAFCQRVAVSVGKHNHLSISSKDPNDISTIETVYVCSNERLASRNLPVNHTNGCSSKGYIQYKIEHNKKRISHPHIERISNDHYYAQVNVKIFNKISGKTTTESHMVKINIQRDDLFSILLGFIGIGTVCTITLVLLLKKKKPQHNNEYTNSDIAQEIGLYD